VLKQAEIGTRVGETCRAIDISEAIFYNQEKKLVGLGVRELWCLRRLDDENERQKKLVANLSLDKEMTE